jgi:hypothetical protein
VITTATNKVTITDNDASVLSVFGTSVIESDGNVGAVRAVLTGASSQDVSVTYTLVPGSAAAGDVALGAFTLFWAAGSTGVRTGIVNITDDAVVEPTESFNVTLSAPTGLATLDAVSSTATITIVDDDSALLTVSTFTVSESAGAPNVVAVTLSGTSSQTVTVDWSTQADSASGTGVDYNNNSGTFSWNAGTSGMQVASVTIVDDALLNRLRCSVCS